MEKRTGYLLIGIGIASILAAAYGAFRSGEAMDALSGVVIGASLIGVVLIERNKKSSKE